MSYRIRPSKLENEFAPDPIVLSILPWFHGFGSMALICSTINGDTQVFLPKFEEISFLSTIEVIVWIVSKVALFINHIIIFQKHKVNLVNLVPPLMVFLAKSPLIDNYNISSLKVIWCGAAPLSKETVEAVQKRIHVPIIRQGYGMTEGTFAFSGQTDDNHSSGSVGMVRAGFMCRIVDESTGESLPAFKQGEILFKGSAVMKGYVNDEDATKRTINSDGWLHTGDVGYYNDDGEIFIVDRIKELIKCNGFQVPPAEIEALLLQHPLIADAGVVGKPDEAAGELPFAFVVKQPNVELTEQDVMKFVAGKNLVYTY